MPINQLERHPFLDYRENPNIKDRKKPYKGIIIGSFPIFSLTSKLDLHLEIIDNNYNNIPNDIRMNFFYGSAKSKLWDLLFNVFINENNINRDNAILLLEENNLIMSDVIFQSNRKNKSASDVDLMVNIQNNIGQNLELNNSIINILNTNEEVVNIFFTAIGLYGKTPFGWFKEIYSNEEIIIENENYIGNNIWSLTIVINKRKFNVFLLPTPKERTIHFTDNQRHIGFCNYLKSIDPLFYNQIINILKANRTPKQKQLLSKHRAAFLIEIYRQAFVFNNLRFDGNINAI